MGWDGPRPLGRETQPGRKTAETQADAPDETSADHHSVCM